MRHISVKNRRRLPQLVMAALSATATVTAFAVALTVGENALPHSATATAEPNSGAWDVISYDNCVHSYPYDKTLDMNRWLDHIHWCCVQTGGVWQEVGAKCVAPPGDASASGQVPPVGEETLTPQRPRPIPIPSDIGTAPATLTQPVTTPYPGG
jgi:hypothetical protein